MDINELKRILESIEDGALEPEEAKDLVKHMVNVIDKIMPHVQRKWSRLILYGVRGTLLELQDHIGEIK